MPVLVEQHSRRSKLSKFINDAFWALLKITFLVEVVIMINDKSSPKFDRKQGTKYSEQYLKKKLSYSNVSPKE